MAKDDRPDYGKGLEEMGLRLFQLYALFGTPSDKWDFESPETGSVVPTHVEWLRGLEAEGTMFMGGPFRAPDYWWDGSGVIFARCDSLEDAKKLSEQDPFFKAGLRTYEIRGWQMNEGQIVLTLDLDSNKIGIS